MSDASKSFKTNPDTIGEQTPLGFPDRDSCSLTLDVQQSTLGVSIGWLLGPKPASDAELSMESQWPTPEIQQFFHVAQVSILALNRIKSLRSRNHYLLNLIHNSQLVPNQSIDFVLQIYFIMHSLVGPHIHFGLSALTLSEHSGVGRANSTSSDDCTEFRVCHPTQEIEHLSAQRVMILVR